MGSSNHSIDLKTISVQPSLQEIVPSAPYPDNDYYLLLPPQTSTASSSTLKYAPYPHKGLENKPQIYDRIVDYTLHNSECYASNSINLYETQEPLPMSMQSFNPTHDKNNSKLHNSSLNNLKDLLVVGKSAARFELSSLKVEKLQKKLKKPFNPIVLTHRSCTDGCCCMLFTVFLIGWAAILILAMMWGKPERLIHPTDSKGRICGYDRLNAYNLSSKPYLQFFDLTKCVSYVTVLTGCPTRQICVEKCPTAYFSYLLLQKGLSLSEFNFQVQNKVLCDDTVDKSKILTFNVLKNFVDQGLCAAYSVNSAPVLGRCLPHVFLDVSKTIQKMQLKPNESLNSLISMLGDDGGAVPTDQQISGSTQVVDNIMNSKAVFQKIVSDINASWWQILAFLLVSGIISLFYMILLRILGGTMIWLSLISLLIMLVVGSTFSWLRYNQLHEAGAVNDYSFHPVITVYFDMPTTWLVFAIILSVIFILILGIFLFVRTRICLAVALIEETSKALGNMLSTLFFPIFPFAVHLIVFVAWGSVTVWLSSSGEENCRRSVSNAFSDIENGKPCDCKSLVKDSTCHYVNITRNNDQILLLQTYNLFAFFWVSCFVSALADMTIAGAFASHYFAFRKPQDVPSFPVLRSLGRSIRFHIGTLAFGSLILSAVKFLQVILDFLNNRLKGAQNVVTKFLYRGLSCFFYILETFLRFLSRNAYILTAIYGKGFCRSSRDSFALLTRNIVRVVVLNRTVAFLLFVGKLSITCGMGTASYFYFTGQWVIDGLPQIYLYYHFVPIIVVTVITFLICDLFFQVYDMGVDTTFLCFLEDSESNDGSVDKPFYMSSSLKKILGKENKF